MKSKITTGIAISGLILVLTVLISRFTYPIPVDLRTTLLITGFTLMLLGTLWKVVIDMNDHGQNQ